MSHNSIVYSELLKKEQRELSYSLRLFDIVVRYIDQSKQGRVKSLIQQITETNNYEKKMAYIDAIRKKLYEDVKNPIINYISFIEVKNTLKNELSILGEETILRDAILIYKDPERFTFSVLEKIASTYTRIKTCNDSIESTKENNEIKSTFFRNKSFDSTKFLDSCIKKDGASELAIYHDVLPYYPELADSTVFSIELFKKLIEFNVLINKIENSKKELKKEVVSIDELLNLVSLVKELTVSNLLNRYTCDFPALIELFNLFGFDNVYETYLSSYKTLSDLYKDNDSYNTKLMPEMVLSEINNEIVFKATSLYNDNEEAYNYAIKYLNDSDKQRLEQAINANNELMEKFRARVYDDSLDSDYTYKKSL